MASSIVPQNAEGRKSEDPTGYGVTEYVEDKIRAQAYRRGSDCGLHYLIDDMAQEGRIAAWEIVREHGFSTAYCLHASKCRIRDFCAHGTSVDRIWPHYKRQRHYWIGKLEQPANDRNADGATLGEMIPDPRHSPEAIALSRIVMDDIEELLTDDEAKLVKAQMAGYTQTELMNAGVFTNYEIGFMQRAIKGKLAIYFDRPELTPEPITTRTPARFRWRSCDWPRQ